MYSQSGIKVQLDFFEVSSPFYHSEALKVLSKSSSCLSEACSGLLEPLTGFLRLAQTSRMQSLSSQSGSGSSIRRVFGFNRWLSIRDLRCQAGYKSIEEIFALLNKRFLTKTLQSGNSVIQFLAGLKLPT